MARRFSLPRAAAWSLTWALGAALGVWLGAYLTAADAAAATGEGAQGSSQLLVLPAIGGAAIFVISFLGRLVFAGGAAVLGANRGSARDADHEGD